MLHSASESIRDGLIIMGSEADGSTTNVRNSTAVDSDGSDTWEDFFGTSTDLVPQLLGMFDELVRRGTSLTSHGSGLQSCGIPAALQKRLSLVSRSRRNSVLNPLYIADESSLPVPSSLVDKEIRKEPDAEMAEAHADEEVSRRQTSSVEINVIDNGMSNNEEVNDDDGSTLDADDNNRKNSNNTNNYSNDYNTAKSNGIQHQNINGLSPLRYNRRCSRTTGSRPLSGSSIASSTSSSGCSNQGIMASAVNPYLASVESLADTCASSQGSADSGVVTVSDSICQGDDNGAAKSSNLQRRDSDEREPLVYQTRPRYCDPNRNPVERVLLEIVDTEAVYVEYLRQVIQGYLIFWRDDPSSLMDQPQLCDLFSNIEDIYEFNSEFLKEIESCELDPVCVANTFIKHNSGFKVYTEYCTNYPRTVAVLTDLMGRERTASAFRERQAALGHALPLGSFLLKPVQRILKYHLLLQNLLKNCDAEFGENETAVDTVAAIEGALTAMTGIARHINAMKRKHEHAVRVQEIQSLLYGWPGPDLTTSGELVAEGRFRMRGAKAPRHAFLFDRMLLLTKKKEDGLLVYKAHILCSNLMLIESIPGEALSFHVIPFDNPRLQYTLQARNLEQKREWTMQIKRVILENYNAVIPSHARQLVMQLGQTQPDDETAADKGSANKKQHSAPPEYLEKRKQERERRKSEIGIRQRLRKSGRKTESNITAVEDISNSPIKNQSTESIASNSRDRSLNRSADGRASKVKDRFTSWRRKSEPGFQSYVSLNQSDEDEKDSEACTEETSVNTEAYDDPDPVVEDADDADDDEADGETATKKSTTTIQLLNNGNNSSNNNSSPPSPLSVTVTPTTTTKDKKQQQQQEHEKQTTTTPPPQTMEEIVGHILMQNRDFQKLLEKQRTSSTINMRQQQRFNKHILSADTSDESDMENDIGSSNNNNRGAVRSARLTRREQRIVRANNARNSNSPPPLNQREEQQNHASNNHHHHHHHPTLRLRYDNLRVENEPSTATTTTTTTTTTMTTAKNRTNRINEKRAIFEAFKRQSIVTESKIIQTALRIRENSATEIDGDEEEDRKKKEEGTADSENLNEPVGGGEERLLKNPASDEAKDGSGFGNYDNLQRVWESVRQRDRGIDGGDSPTRPAVWLNKLCEALPTATQKCGSLPRSFQINPHQNVPYPQLTKSRFLQRDGKPMSERPFTIASDKPAEINLEDMERYASSCQQEGSRIAKFPTSASTSTFFCSLEDDSFVDHYSEIHSSSSAVGNVHPDHKIYRGNGGGNGNSPRTIFRNVFLKAGNNNRRSGLRATESVETLDCSDEAERSKQFQSNNGGGASKAKKKPKSKSSRVESSSEVDEVTSGCAATASAGSAAHSSKTSPKIPSAYYKQGSSGLGARIAQSDYADPTVLFGDSILKRAESLGEGLLSLQRDCNVRTMNGDSNDKENEDAGEGEESTDRHERRESEADSFYEKSFEIIENYVDPEADEVFRDSAIFSDMDEIMSAKITPTAVVPPVDNRKAAPAVPKVAPPVPAKKKQSDIFAARSEFFIGNKQQQQQEIEKAKPIVAQKPNYLRAKSVFKDELETTISRNLKKSNAAINRIKPSVSGENIERGSQNPDEERDDVSAGQSRAGWVRKMVGQLQGQEET